VGAGGAPAAAAASVSAGDRPVSWAAWTMYTSSMRSMTSVGTTHSSSSKGARVLRLGQIHRHRQAHCSSGGCSDWYYSIGVTQAEVFAVGCAGHICRKQQCQHSSCHPLPMRPHLAAALLSC
jgi:hypothetical protein